MLADKDTRLYVFLVYKLCGGVCIDETDTRERL